MLVYTYYQQKTYWSKIIFNDEKKFNFDGEGGTNSYWHNFEKEKDVFSTRQIERGFLIVWADFYSGSKVRITFMKEKK